MSALNILLVDGNRNLVTTLSAGLRKAIEKAISVAVCFPWHRPPGQVSGSEALSRLAIERFDVVVGDFNIPGVPALELMNKIRQEYRETILILTTANGTAALEEELHRLGIGYIAKPIGLSLLVQFIHDLIRNATENAPRILIPDPQGKAGMP